MYSFYSFIIIKSYKIAIEIKFIYFSFFFQIKITNLDIFIKVVWKREDIGVYTYKQKESIKN